MRVKCVKPTLHGGGSFFYTSVVLVRVRFKDLGGGAGVLAYKGNVRKNRLHARRGMNGAEQEPAFFYACRQLQRP